MNIFYDTNTIFSDLWLRLDMKLELNHQITLTLDSWLTNQLYSESNSELDNLSKDLDDELRW